MNLPAAAMMLRSIVLLAVVSLAAPVLARAHGDHPEGVRFAQSEGRSAVTPAFMVGEWSTRNIEFGTDVEILWTLWPDGRLNYRFIVGGEAREGSRGTWSLDGDVVLEKWIRPDGSTGEGRGRIERIDEATIRLTIVDNGSAEYQGMVRVYRRRGAPQVSMVVR